MDSTATYSQCPKSGTKSRILPDGSHCPQNTYVRYSSKLNDWVYYAKITTRGVLSEFNTGILAGTPGSRQAVCEWVAQKSQQLLDGQYDAAKYAQLSKQVADGTFRIEKTEETDRWLGNMLKLELNRIVTEHGENSPSYKTIEMHLNRVCTFFGHERDASTLTRKDIDNYRIERRKQLHRGQPPSFGTIKRELVSLQRGIKEANSYGIFNPPYILPIDTKQWNKLMKRDVTSDRRSHIHTHEQCMAWIAAAKGTRFEHHTYLAYATGMRAGCLYALRWKWVYRTPNAKHYAEIRLPEALYRESNLDDQPIAIAENVYRYIERIASTLGGRDEPLLVNPNGIDDWTKMMVKKKFGGKLKITLRDLRASAGQRVYDMTGKDIKATQIFMCHKDIKTTMKHYLRATDSDYKAIAMTMEGLG